MKTHKLYRHFKNFSRCFGEEIKKLDEYDKECAQFFKNIEIYDAQKFTELFAKTQQQIEFLYPIMENICNQGKLLEKSLETYNANIQRLIDKGILMPLNSEAKENKNENIS